MSDHGRADMEAVYLAAVAARSGDPETYLSWSDDGVTLICEREACKVTNRGSTRTYWYQVELPYKLTPEMAAAARDTHVATHA